MTLRIACTVATALLASFSMAGCGDMPGGPQPTRPSAASADPAITLLTRLDIGHSDGSSEALIEGKLNVGPADCVRIGRFLLVAPPGSIATAEGIELPGIGSFAFGARMSVGGAYIFHSDLTVPGTDRCRTGDTEPRETAVVG